MRSGKMIGAKVVAAMGVFSALVAGATMAFSLYIPATRGYFNVGETMVYLAALLMGPVVGAFAGGVGSMLADLALGYYVFAPATLVIKACEGFLVGFLSPRRPSNLFRGEAILNPASAALLMLGVAALATVPLGASLPVAGLVAAFGLGFPLLLSLYIAREGTGSGVKGLALAEWRTMAVLMGGAIALTVWSLGTAYYSGQAEPSIGLPLLGYLSGALYIPETFWASLAVLTFLAIVAAGFSVDPEIGWAILAILLGGATMVLGYFLYEQLILGVAAFAEVPFNVGQVTVGLLVSLPLYRAISRATRLEPARAPPA